MHRKKIILLTIKQEMFLLGFASLILASLIFIIIFFMFFYSGSLSSVKNTLHTCNSQIVTYVEGVFHESAILVDMLAKNQTVIQAGNGDKRAVTDIFEGVKKGNTNITYLYAGYSNGDLYISDYDTPADYKLVERPWYLASQEAEGVARLVYTDAATGEWLFSHCKKLLDSQGNMVGAVCIDSSNENISRQLSTKYQYESQRSFITNQDGMVLIHPDEKEINNSLLEGRIHEEAWAAIVNGEGNYAEYPQHGRQSMAYFERIPNTDFIVVTAVNASEVIHPILYSLLYIIILVIAISILLGFCLSQILDRRFVRPIMELGERIQGIASGKSKQQRRIRSSNAEINRIAGSIEIIVRDIAAREEERKTAEYLSQHDSMTGLYNRRYFDEKLQRLDTPENYPLCIVSCDVNGLKLANDVFGHAVGDRLLLLIAECLKNACREGGFGARIGGDEFFMVFPDTSASAAEQIMTRIRTALWGQNINGAEVSVSMGFAIKTEPALELAQVIRSADERMYAYKRSAGVQMKRKTVENILDAAAAEGLVKPPYEQEEALLRHFAHTLCPEQEKLLRESYRLRKIGLCSLILQNGGSDAERSHTEHAYRILSVLDDSRGMAGCILHHTEHWDGSGWPAGLSGKDIPLLSRIIAVVSAFCQGSGLGPVQAQKGTLYDPELVEILVEKLEKK